MSRDVIAERIQGSASLITSKAVVFYSAGFSGLLSLVSYFSAATPEISAGAIAVGQGSLGLGILAYFTHVTTKIVEHRKNVMQFELDRFKIKKEDRNAQRIQDLEDRRIRDEEIREEQRGRDEENRRLARDLSQADILKLRNRTDSAEAKVQGIAKAVRKNGRAVKAIGDEFGFSVDPGLPPDGTGDFPMMNLAIEDKSKKDGNHDE